MNTELLTTLLIIAVTSSSITCAFIQKTKSKISKKWLLWYSLAVNMVLGILFTLTFTDSTIVQGAWVGLFSFIGADTLYKTLEGKLKPYSELTKKEDLEEIPRSDE